MSSTLFEKIWAAHRIDEVEPGIDLLSVDLHFLTDVRSKAFRALEEWGLAVQRPDRTIGIIDHVVSTEGGRQGGLADWSATHIANMRAGASRHGVALLDVNDADQGIAHVVGPELGLTQPGHLIVCPDSHTSTNGGLGALAWGIGFTEVVHVLATQTIVQRRPKTMRISFDGELPAWVEPKDLVLHLIGRIGTAGAAGYAVEFAGPLTARLGAEGRMTICNLSIEMGAKIGLIAPDALTEEYLSGRPFSPPEEDWSRATRYWRTLRSDDDAVFDREIRVGAEALKPQITWGTSPEDVVAIDGVTPDLAGDADASRRNAWEAALAYMDLRPGQRLAGTRIDRAFIGSCSNARLSDLRIAAEVARGRKVAPHVEAWVVPGSQRVKREAEALGLDEVFRDAGFGWREPGCSLCAGANGEVVLPGQRCVSTSNRNFVGRQGPGARTHLASAATAAASAIAGELADVRAVMN